MTEHYRENHREYTVRRSRVFRNFTQQTMCFCSPRAKQQPNSHTERIMAEEAAPAQAVEFKLYTWKDVVSNRSKDDARQWFKEHYPTATNHSIWLATYKYPDDLKSLLFMNENLVAGYLQEQSMDAGVRKLGFGSCFIHGPSETAKFVVTQLWVFNSEEMPQLFVDSYLYSNFEFTKLDFNDPTAQEQILDMLVKDEDDECVAGLVGKPLSKETYK